MFVQQFFVKGLAHSSYLLSCGDQCAIIDPQRDADVRQGSVPLRSGPGIEASRGAEDRR